MSEEIMVSVLCPTFNHEKYIRRCLEGFVVQKTNFKYEIIINDDASSDDTAKIIQEYEKKYPDIIKPIYQTENQFSKNPWIFLGILLPHAKGKYVALCEGDDFWIDPLKLQRQIDALEENPTCKMAVCRVLRVSEDERTEMGFCPSFSMEKGVIPSDFFFDLIFNEYSFHTSSYVFNTDCFRKLGENMPEFVANCPVGDEAYMLFFGTVGDVYYCEETMSCNRRGSINGWNANTWSNPERRRKYFQGMAKTYECFDEYTNGKYHNQCRNRIFLENYFIAENKEDFRKLLYDEPDVFHKQSKRTKIRVLVGAYCLPILKLYYKLKK